MIEFFSTDELNINVSSSISKKKVAGDILKLADSTVVDSGAIPFEPIGIGKPLVIRLHTVYVGNLKTGIFIKKQDVLVTSIIKDDITYDVPAMGVHQVFDKSKDRDILFPKASNEGTELIYYTKAFDQNKLLVDIEVKADRFEHEITDNISKILAGAGSLPVFIPYAPYIIVGSQLLQISGGILNDIMGKTTPVLNATYNISQDIGGLRNTTAGFKIGINTRHANAMKGCKIVENPLIENQFYLEKDGSKYEGDIPYMIISIDGATVPKYDNFKAAIASASILKRFYGDLKSNLVNELQKMMEVYNDFNYIGKIEKLDKELKKPTTPEKKKELEDLLNAYKENIVNKDIFKTNQ